MNDELKALGETFAKDLKATYVTGGNLRTELNNRLTAAGLGKLDYYKGEWLCIQTAFGGKWVRRVAQVSAFYFGADYIDLTFGPDILRWSERDGWQLVFKDNKVWPVTDIERL
jgi:hypothetical protein